MGGQVDLAAVGPERVLSLLRQAQAALRASEERFRAVVENSSDIVALLDQDGRVGYASGALYRSLGHDVGAIVGQPLAELVHAEDREAFARAFELCLRRGEAPLRVELRVVPRASAESRVLEVTLSNRLEVPGLDAVIVSARDVTDRLRAQEALRRSEASFRQLLESAPDAMVIADAAGNIVLVNARAEEMFGYRRSELLGRPITLLVPAKAAASLRARGVPTEVAASRESAAALALSVRRKDGGEFPVEVSLSALETHEGRLICAAVRDVSERNRIQAQLLTSERLASVGMLAAGVAHEINNPLAAIMANLDLVARELAGRHADAPTTDRTRPDLTSIEEQVQAAREATDRVRQIVRDLKIFSRSTDDRRALADIEHVLDTSARMAWNEIRHRARLKKEYGGVPPVYANEARLGQVFLNLLVNAAQAIPEGNADDNTIRLVTRVDAQSRVVVEIADTGVGITPEVRERLFTPFFTTKPIGEGTGLGLAICHRIVSEIGGEITVTSEPGQGSVFRVALPQSERAAPAEAKGPPPMTKAARRGRVLVVDDEPMVNAAVRRTLRGEHDVVTTTSAQEALDSVRAGARYDVIICDVMMPQMTGMDLHRALMEEAPDQAAKIIFLTGGAFTPGARAFLDEVPNARLEKPFDTRQLRTLVNERLA